MINTNKLISAAGCLLCLSGALLVGGCGGSDNGPQVYSQVDRLARPAINEVLATVANNRHKVNDENNPTDDAGQLKNDILAFMTGPTSTAGRSPGVANALAAVLVPDVMMADLSKAGPAAYLGVETAGATGGLFGGRALTDDVVDIDLGAIFGPTLTNAPGGLGLVTDDGAEIPALTSDHVDASGKHFSGTFPYLGAPS
jgi:hypothetical protein